MGEREDALAGLKKAGLGLLEAKKKVAATTGYSEQQDAKLDVENATDELLVALSHWVAKLDP